MAFNRKTLRKQIGARGFSVSLAVVLAACAVDQRPGASRPGSDMEGNRNGSRTQCRRIISLAPSITEILFAIGLGSQTVGVTTFCDYPPAVLSVAKIGGYSTPNYEAVVTLQPDLVILLGLHREAEDQLRKLGIATLAVEHNSVGQVLESIQKIGSVCNAEAEAKQLAQSLRRKVAAIRRRVADRGRPRVMVSVGRHGGTGSLKEVFVAAQGTFLDELIDLAGGLNVAGDIAVQYPRISVEGILQLNPEIILDMIPELRQRQWKIENLLADWQNLEIIEAVRRGQVQIMADEFLLRPGPRFVLTLEQMARAIHPEAGWE